MLTTAPDPDVAAYHDRQVAVLPPADWPVWINMTRPERDLQPLPAGSPQVETVRQPVGPPASERLGRLVGVVDSSRSRSKPPQPALI
jgi:putative SOS response-associated peptidase YedK